MSDMVERVARAIMNEAKSLGAMAHHVGGEHSLERRLARAAIEAMREPTFNMTMAGQSSVYHGGARSGPANIAVTTSSFSTIFTAMIDAALKD